MRTYDLIAGVQFGYGTMLYDPRMNHEAKTENNLLFQQAMADALEKVSKSRPVVNEPLYPLR